MILPLSLLSTLLLAISQIGALDTKVEIYEDYLCNDRISAVEIVNGPNGAAWFDKNPDIPGTQAFKFTGHVGWPWCMYSSYEEHGCKWKYREVGREDIERGCSVLPTGDYTSFRVYPWECDADMKFDCKE